MAKTSLLKREWLDRISGPVPEEQGTAPIFNLPIAEQVQQEEETPESKVSRYIDEHMAKFNAAKESSAQGVLKKKEAREGQEDQRNLGRLLGTLLGHVMSGGDKRRTSRVMLPTIAEATKGEELNQLLTERDVEDHNIGLNAYMKSIVEGQDFFKTLEAERLKQKHARELEELKLANQDNFQKQLIQDDAGNYYGVSFDKQNSKFTPTKLGIKGKPKSSDESLDYRKRRDAERDTKEAQREIQKIERVHAENTKLISSLKSKDAEDVLSTLQRENPKFVGLDTEQAIEALKDYQIQLEDDMNYWQSEAGWEETPGWYKGKKKEESKYPLGKPLPQY